MNKKNVNPPGHFLQSYYGMEVMEQIPPHSRGRPKGGVLAKCMWTVRQRDSNN
jgi:hypothetical protein